MRPLVLALAVFTASSLLAVGETPHLRKNGAATQLIVDGQPFLALAGELHNSSSTSRAYMKPIWPKLAQMNLNTVLAVVPWGLVEPQEGKYDFTLVDQLIEDARAHKLRLSLLWFGSWKNGLSHYVPTWVKADTKRFPYARTSHGTVEILSVFSEATREADAKAFAAFMRHLREVDGSQHTVVMIQVQNEVGLHGDTRDRSTFANAAFAQPVPRELLDYLQKHRDALTPSLRAAWASSNFKTAGTWAEVFGESPAAEEAFMAWHYARFVNRVTEAGKAEYKLPMFVNAWIVQPEDEFPGEYPSGGPQAHVLDLWRAGAPAVDIFAPDIYLPNFTEVCAEFARPGEPFFVPESRAGFEGVGNAFVAIGAFNGIGYSPFGIEGRESDPANGPIARSYDVLRQLSPLILEQQAKGGIMGVTLTTQNNARKFVLGNYTIRAALPVNRRTGQSPERGYGLFLAVGPDEFIVAGGDLNVTFATAPAGDGDQVVGLADVEEGVFQNGKWVPGRNLNGDEIMISYDLPTMAATRQTGTGLRFNGPNPTLQRVKLYRFAQTK
jgi:beta-galactosidase GanA